MSARWLGGDPGICAELERVFAGTHPRAKLEPLGGRMGRRRLARVTLDSGERLFVKQYAGASRKYRYRERAKNALGLSTTRREWRALGALYAAGVPVPEPRALLVLPGGDRVLATRWLEGRTLRDALRGGAPARVLAPAVGDLVSRVHAAGWVHRGLHAGNVLVTETQLVALDLQSARATRSRRARLRDLGELDYSLETQLSHTARMRLRARALGCTPPFGEGERATLRAIGDAASRRARRHARSRTGRALSPGRRFATVRVEGYRGLRLREVPEESVVAAVEAPGFSLKTDSRSEVCRVDGLQGGSVVRKAFPARGWLRALADRLRGSPAQRAWIGGHGLLARRIGAATPLAFLERRRFGLPVSSLVLLEDLTGWCAADACDAAEDDLANALGELARALHRFGVVHGDLKASHVLLSREDGALRTRLLDLEGVRFPERLSDTERIRALAELNASLPDRIGSGCRRRAFARYAAALPFSIPRDEALLRIAQESLERAHRWSGSDCQVLTITQRK